MLPNFLPAKYFQIIFIPYFGGIEIQLLHLCFFGPVFFNFFKNYSLFSILLESLISSTNSQKLLLIILRLIQSALITYGEFQHI